MPHEREFHRELTDEEREKRRDLALTAVAYARLFATDDGQTVLADLHSRFSYSRSRFGKFGEQVPPGHAERMEGQCDVLREIEATIEVGQKPKTQQT